MKRTTRILICVVLGVIFAGALAWVQVRNENLPASSAPFEKGPFGGDFAGLLNQDGVVQKPDSFHDKYQLVFFGFTHCPSICPGELQKVSFVMQSLNDKQRARLAPIFVSVDPARDTPDVIKGYLAMFHPGITGLTGKQADIDRMLSEWKIYARKVPQDDGYTMDHSAFMYLRDPQGWLIDLFEISMPPEKVAEAVSRAIGN